MEKIEMERWDRDHWSMLGYVAAGAFDGKLDRKRMRCNPERHPLLAGSGSRDLSQPWREEWGTKLKEPTERLPEHDDWDVLEDLENAGLVEIFSLVNGSVRLTPKGNLLAFQLREHKAHGGSFSTFLPTGLDNLISPI